MNTVCQSIAFSSATSLPLGSMLGTKNVSQQTSFRCTPSMGPWKKGEKDEAFQKQQEILARRRNKNRNTEYFEEIKKRREAIEQYYDKRRLKVPHGEDPIVAWKKLKEEGLIDQSSYSEMDEGGIPIPMASFGIPQYDNGGRFDLRLPHVEIGYTDDDADIMGKAGKAFKKLFGFGKKKEDDTQSADNENPSQKQ